MKNFIYINSNKSGIGDRLLDLFLVYSYSEYLNYDKLYLHWTEDKEDMVGNNSIYSKIRKNCTPFREKDYLLQNLKYYFKLPDNILFVNADELKYIIDEKNPNKNLLFNDYLGLKFTLYTFMEHYSIKNKEKFKEIYFSNFKKIKFENIPENIQNYFKNNDVITIHLRRGDKVVNDNGTSNNVTHDGLSILNNLTIDCINKLISLNYNDFCFVSDEKSVRDYYIELFKNKVNCKNFDGDEVSQTYYDLYSLTYSKKIILSQTFSSYSVFSSMINGAELYYLLNKDKIHSFSSYSNICKFNINNLIPNIKYFNRNINVNIYDIDKYNFTYLIKNCYSNYFKKDIELDKLHEHLDNELITENDRDFFKKISIFGKTDRNSIFNKIFYEYYDRNNDFETLYIKFIKEFIKPIYFKNEKYLVIQKTPNIRQQLPNTTTLGRLESDISSEFIGIHKDRDLYHSEFEFNFLLSITKMFDTNSIYFEKYPNSNIDYREYDCVNQEIGELGCYYFNGCYHYNKVNLTGKTRISLDFRIIPFSKYNSTDKKTITKNSRLIIGDYFMKIEC